MPIDKTANHEKIVAAAKKEFLTYGFTDASMRHIAEEAGMSASGLYKHFASKEEMFSALVEPAYQGLLSIFHLEADDQEQSVGTGDLSLLESGQDAKLSIEYIYDHLDAFRLIICKSKGTKYESFLHDLAVLEEKMTLSYMEALKKQGVRLNEFDERELHLLTTTNINAVFQTVEHDLTREEAMHYAYTLDRFFSKAWKEFFGY
ncbi:MAG: TetR/AcrR family transcriptional regulator [Lachnospiraceae bacterium]|nr:TetR/AcrR family transcriptional regulator [Lachnospiraceae bacterium]